MKILDIRCLVDPRSVLIPENRAHSNNKNLREEQLQTLLNSLEDK